MLWIVFSVICAAYYAAVRYVAQGQQMTVIWLILAVLFFALFLGNRLQKKYPHHRKRSLRIRTFCVTSLILFCIMIGVVTGRILVDMWSSPVRNLSYIVLLNQSDVATESEEEWEARMDQAIRYLNTNETTRVVVSGGWDSDLGYSEAHAMYAYLLENGIDGGRVYWEIRAKNTKDNLGYARTICAGDRQPVGIAASDYSMYRTLRIARNQGYLQAEPIPTPTTPWLYPHRIVQEILQVLYDKFFGI